MNRPAPSHLRFLNMAETDLFPDIWAPLAGLAEVVTVPADAHVLADLLPDFDAYFATLHARLTADMIASAPRLKVVVTPSTGLDHLDLPALAEHGVALLSLKDDTEFLDSITATAEMAWGLLLAVARKLPWSFAAAQRGEWARDRYRGMQLSGKTLGLLGYGRLGRIVAEYGKAFRMKVLACDVRPVQPAPGVRMVDFDALLRQSDVLSLHIHLTEENRGLLDAAACARMKPGALLLNTSRGAIIDEAALLAVLESGRLGGAGLDVIEGEWREDLGAHPLIRYAATHENLVISPHTGGVTCESQYLTIAHMIRKLARFLEDLP
jgi:D-3-phosphoglycerate dehydrogenase